MGLVEQYLSEDHRRLEALLATATLAPNEVNPGAYWDFRAGLLRHIGIEERILLPTAQKLRDGVPLPEAARLRLDHSALGSLLVLKPTKPVVEAIATILDRHNVIEEGPDGVYSQCERLPGFDTDAILVRIKNAPSVRMAPYSDSSIAHASARISLKRAGYDMNV